MRCAGPDGPVAFADSIGGSDFFWEDVQKTVDSQYQAAEQNGEAGGRLLAELKELRERLNVLQRTGTVPEHPAQAYDRAVGAAINRMLPGADTVRQQRRSREVADFVVRYRGSELFVETKKWRSDPAQQFGGSTFPALVEHLPAASPVAGRGECAAHALGACDILDALGGRGGAFLGGTSATTMLLVRRLPLSLLGKEAEQASQS